MTALVRVIYIGGDNESICSNNILELVVDCNRTRLLINMMCRSGEEQRCCIKRLITFPRNKVFTPHLWNYIRRRVMYFSCISRPNVACLNVLTLTTLKYFCINHGNWRFFQFEIIINVLV